MALHLRNAPASQAGRTRLVQGVVLVGFCLLIAGSLGLGRLTAAASGRADDTIRGIVREQETLAQLTRFAHGVEMATASASLYHATGDPDAFERYANALEDVTDVAWRMKALTGPAGVPGRSIDSLLAARAHLEGVLRDLVKTGPREPGRGTMTDPGPEAAHVIAQATQVLNQVSATLYQGNLRMTEASAALRRAIRFGESAVVLLIGLLAVLLVRDHRDRNRTLMRAHRAQRQSEDRYRSLIESAPIGVCVHDGREIHYLNPALAGLLGVAPADGAEAVLSTERTRELLLALTTVGRDERVVRSLRRLDGLEVRAEIRGIGIVEQDGPAVLLVVLDVSERERMEERLRRQQGFLRQILDTVPSLVYVRDDRGRLELANRAMADWYGATPETLEGRLVGALGSVGPATANPEVDRAVLESGVPRVGLEESVTDPETRAIHWFHSARVPFHPGGDGGRLELVVSTEVTERKHLENQFLHSQKLEAVGRLAGGVAHDFNNMLTAVLGSVEFLADGQPSNSPLMHDLETIRIASLRARDLTRQLLAFSRQQILDVHVLDVNEAVTGVQRMLRRLIGEDVQVQTLLGANVGAIRADPGQLEQVIVNLAVNARDAMPKGGRLTIETAKVWLDETYVKDHGSARPGSYVMLAVSDTGVGMDAVTRARIFEPFFTTKELGKGTGLGLSTVYGIVKQSGGNIWVYSEPGRGTTFKVYLPEVQLAPEAVAAPSDVGGMVRGTETILIVEDEETVRTTLRRVLERCGYRLLVAEGPRAALELAAGFGAPIDLLVTDVVMPDMSGRALAEALQAARPALPVLYISGYTDSFIVHEGMLDEGVAFLQKPFLPSALARRVRDVLDGRLLTPVLGVPAIRPGAG